MESKYTAPYSTRARWIGSVVIKLVHFSSGKAIKTFTSLFFATENHQQQAGLVSAIATRVSAR